MSAAEFVRMFVRADWMAEAACRGMETSIFYPEHGQRAENARKVCQTCPVIDQCGEYALDNGERFGVWGGGSIDRRRRAVRSGKPRTSKGSGGQWKPIAHGTLNGYRQEKRRGVPPCDECLAARAAWKRELRAQGNKAA